MFPRNAIVVGGLALEALIAPVLGLVTGSYLDDHFGWKPWGAIVGMVLGFVAAIRISFKLYRFYMSTLDKD